MSPALVKYLFSAEDYIEVQSFDCGSKPYQLEVSDWLKAPADQDGALAAIGSDPPAKVWLYRQNNYASNSEQPGEIVGFGAISQSKWRWTEKKDPYIPVTVILWLAVQTKFKRQPDGDPDGYYSSQIVDGLIAESLETQNDRPVLGLCVRPDNTAAIDLYRRKAFKVELSPWLDRDTGVSYSRLARILNPTRLLEMTKGVK